ncbi:hypothetical protein M407DRAFT_217734 [Tulasnella calospora MUT 4182]|uniref:Uncharacterized protein n=1 Tax=Tulasnella calospora MUT 4182 TaxID=1051891 RepID=A0A0C3MD57_9AGAM|nr:hypothetical protein M407DRAFT_217734 [Tulasnella calospora MUT 4182]
MPFLGVSFEEFRTTFSIESLGDLRCLWSWCSFGIRTVGSEVTRHLLFASPVVDAIKLSRLAWLESEALSKDDPWREYMTRIFVSLDDAGNCNWFEIGIFRSSDDIWALYNAHETLRPIYTEGAIPPAANSDGGELLT